MRLRTVVSTLLAVACFALPQSPARAGNNETFCGEATAPQCDGLCPPLSHCVEIPPSDATTSIINNGECACVPDVVIVGECGEEPQCGGSCPIGAECVPASELFDAAPQGEQGICLCALPTCGFSPQCGGDCPEDSVCLPLEVTATVDEKDPGATTQGIPDGPLPCTCVSRGEPGGCCLPNETCAQLDRFDCLEAGGAFAGEGVACIADLCSGPGVYEDSECTTPFEDISATGTPLSLVDDDGEVVPLGFTFAFYTIAHTTVGISSNGYLSFGSNLTVFSDQPIPNSNEPNDLIAPLWDDLNPATGGTVHYQTLGAAPNRRFIVQWTMVPEWIADGANTFQVILHEGSNTIEFRYGDLSASDGTIGVENPPGLAGTSVSRASIGSGDCVLLTPTAVAPATPAEAPTLSSRGIAILVFALLGIALLAMRRALASRRE